MPLCESQMAVMEGDGVRFRKMEQIFATFDANHDGALSKVRDIRHGRIQGGQCRTTALENLDLVVLRVHRHLRLIAFGHCTLHMVHDSSISRSAVVSCPYAHCMSYLYQQAVIGESEARHVWLTPTHILPEL